MADFMFAYPEISIDIEFTQRVSNLLTEKIDVAIRMRGLQDSSLIARKLGTFPLRLSANATYYSRKSLPQHPNELDAKDCISLNVEGDGTWLFQSGSEEFRIIPQNRFQANNVLAIQKAVLKGIGISVIPQKMCVPYLNKELIPLLEGYSLEDANVYTVYPSKKYISSKLSVFLDYLQEHLLG